jgi:hypothetical protein
VLGLIDSQVKAVWRWSAGTTCCRPRSSWTPSAPLPGGHPHNPVPRGCTDVERDAVRAYARQEWIASQERWPGI